MIKFAIGTDDGIEFSKHHFGSSQKYLIYTFDLETNKIIHIDTIQNITPEERKHGDPEKAQNIGSLLKGVSVLVAKRMGSNVARMRKKFVPIMCKDVNIEQALERLPKYIEQIQMGLAKPMGEDKEIIKLNL